ncbi:MAG: purine-nucleoside phosphorylase [Deltaproteobacteria bacterium]|nr:purine-nucleoside phosphorylase [Deltaproteobacteria bacterium]MBN2673623.1 purine-nucleoside phosphorylase [Deltaproteobacteria bacterium]
MNEEWNRVDHIAAFLNERLGSAPDIVLVLGSGLRDGAFGLSDERSVSFSEIPDWPRSTVAGHNGVLKRGRMGDKEVLLQLGRVHLYEGYSEAEVVRPTRSVMQWGARYLIATNAAGGINEYLKPGGLMILEDHLNLTGRNPLIGQNDESRGARFPDMTETYSRRLRALLVEEATDLGVEFKMGVYAGLLGPSYETPAEVNMLRQMGADAVGMSTVLEVIAAKHMGADVAGISCISNMAASYNGPKLTHEDVQAAAGRASESLTRLVAAMVAKIEPSKVG